MKTIRGNPEGIPAHWGGELSTVFPERLNSVSGAVKRKARDYRSTDYLVMMLYFVAGRVSMAAYPSHGN
ncbi:MAG: hypothetical protein DVB31_07445 [Verrucomicrobia bacterium]|nr:MAG: hypothetical protein DVB31_07445 [Verrucomicrobiota bacterium]